VILIAGVGSCDGGASCGGLAEWYLSASSSEGGQVIVSGGPTFANGTVVMLEAVADECYQFVSWTGDVDDPYSPTTTVTMDQAQNVTANFALLIYDLTVSSTDGGQVTSPGEVTAAYDCGTVVPLVAAAEEGYYFVNWTGDVSTVANVNSASTTITMNGDYSITANFEVEETTPVTLFQAVHFGQNQGNWNVGLWKHYGNGTQDGYVNHGGSGAVRWDDGSQGTDQGLTHNFTLTYDPTTYTLSFEVTGGSKTVLETATSPVVPPAAPGPVNNLHMVIRATAGTNVSCANQSSMPKQQVDSSKTTVSGLALDGTPLTGIEVEAKLVDNPTSESFTNTAELDIPVPTGVAWTLTGNISVAFVAANMACPPKQWRIGMPQLDGRYA
jgi:hypothetical protein